MWILGLKGLSVKKKLRPYLLASFSSSKNASIGKRGAWFTTFRGAATGRHVRRSINKPMTNKWCILA